MQRSAEILPCARASTIYLVVNYWRLSLYHFSLSSEDSKMGARTFRVSLSLVLLMLCMRIEGGSASICVCSELFLFSTDSFESMIIDAPVYSYVVLWGELNLIIINFVKWYR